MSSWKAFIFLVLWTQYLTFTCSLNALIFHLMLHDVTVWPSEDVNAIKCRNEPRVRPAQRSADGRQQWQKPKHTHCRENEGYQHFSHFSFRFFWQQFDLHTTVLLLVPYILRRFLQRNLNTIKAIKAYQQQHRVKRFLDRVTTTAIENETFHACCWSQNNHSRLEQCQTNGQKWHCTVRHFHDYVTHSVLPTVAKPYSV